jgi:SRSO17 transposase
MLEELLSRVAGRFPRVEPRRRIQGFVLGLLVDLPRKNCWTIAEHAGEASPDGMQHLLARAVWDTDGVRDDLREFVVERLGDPGAVLVVDETGDVKKGTATVGTQRQYTGTAGRVDNAQVAVYLTYAGQAGHAMIDRELYLPKSWTIDPQRCAGAGIPEDVEFATKPALAGAMITRALDAGVPARWVAGDEVYGADPGLRTRLEARQVGYVLAIGCDRRVLTAAGPMRADAVAATLPKGAWQRLSAGSGAKGQRYYDWAWVTVSAQAGHHWLLISRHPRHGELAFYHCYSPTLVPLGELVRVAGRRWTIEESFQAGKGLAGLDRAPGPPLAGLAALDPARDARPRPTRGHRRNRTHRTPPSARADRLDLQRNPTPADQADHRTQPPTHRPHCLVLLATTPSTPCPRLSLPPPTSSAHVITIYGCSTRRSPCTGPRRSTPRDSGSSSPGRSSP